MAINWTELIQNIGISGLIVAGISWTVKKLGDHYLERKLVVFEKALETKSKEYKFQLDLVFAKSTKLLEKRLTILEDNYRKIITLNMKMNEMIALMKPIIQDADKEENDRIENVGNQIMTFCNAI
jgi:hypothetical protein